MNHALYKTPTIEIREMGYPTIVVPGVIKCQRCECYELCMPAHCLGRPASASDQWLFHVTNWSQYAMREITDKNIKAHYTDLRMMQDKLDGHDVATIAAAWGCTKRVAHAHIKAIASECMRQAMEQTQADPDHPSTQRFTLEDFTRDPRAAMAAIMRSHIAAIEERYQDTQ